MLKVLLLSAILPNHYLIALEEAGVRDMPVNVQYVKPSHSYVNRLTGRGKIFYNPLIGYQVKFNQLCTKASSHCVVSPLDVLVHEALHVAYPSDTEANTIEREVRLFQKLNLIDGKSRPLRSTHQGKPIKVKCQTCTE